MRNHGASVLLCVLLVVGFASGPAVPARAAPSDGAAPSEIESDGQGGGLPAGATLQLGDEGRNDSARHENPAAYEGRGRLPWLESRLSDRLLQRINMSAALLEDGEYGRAEEYVGTEYEEYLDQYAEVAARTDGAAHGDAFAAIREDQRRLTEAADRYEALRAEYDRARTAGNEDRARELARELDRVATNASETGTQLRESYDEIERSSGANLSTSDRAIETVTEDIRSSQRRIREEQFVETTLSIDHDRREISFTEPLTGTGRLETADGRPVSDRRIELAIGNGSVRTETDADGSFDFAYRPVTEPVTTDRLSIEYVPDGGSTHLGSDAVVPVSITPSEPTVHDLDAPEAVTYDDDATVTGTFAVGETPVDGARLVVVLGDERIETTETENGSFAAEATVPASVAAGEREIGVRFARANRSIADSPVTTPILVRETEGALSVSAARSADGDRTVTIGGTLETVDGEGVADETVRIDVAGTTVGAATTDDRGSFERTATIPDERGDEVSVVATYDGSDSNVAPATARTTVTLSTTGSNSLGWVPTWAWIGVGALALVLLGGLAVRWRTRSSRQRDDGEVDGPTQREPSDRTPDRSRRDAAYTLLARGRSCLANDRPDQAVVLGYAAVRCAFEDPTTASSAVTTHREFYRDWRSDRDGTAAADDERHLRRLVDCYERSTFGGTVVSAAEAEAVLETASKLCEPNR